MPRRKTPPSVDEIRCPNCRSIAWRRVGERVVEDSQEGAARPRVRHIFLRDDGPWDWTCERCGLTIKAGTRLEHQVSNVQARRGFGAGVLAGFGDLLERLRTAGSGARAAVGTTVVTAAVAAAVVLSSVAGKAPQQTPAVTPAARVNAGVVPSPTDGESPAERPVDLDGVVARVTGDATFWIGSAPAEETFVVLDETTQGEYRVTVRAGQRVRIEGRLERTPVRGVHLQAGDREALRAEALYIRAHRVEIIGD